MALNAATTRPGRRSQADRRHNPVQDECGAVQPSNVSMSSTPLRFATSNPPSSTAGRSQTHFAGRTCSTVCSARSTPCLRHDTRRRARHARRTARAEFPRVALFRVKGNRLEGTHQIGFDLTNDIGKVIIPLAMDSLLTRAVTSGRTERLSGDAIDTSGLPFGGSPSFALAMPIVVDAESIAIVYADDFAEPRAEARYDDDMNAKFAEALRQHTVALLMRLTTELKAMAELRAYAYRYSPKRRCTNRVSAEARGRAS